MTHYYDNYNTTGHLNNDCSIDDCLNNDSNIDLHNFVTSLPLNIHIRIRILIGSNGTNNVNMKDSFFSFGNTTVLDWGRVLPEAAFHSNGESYL